MSENNPSVTVISSDHFYVGTLPCDGVRVLDFLSDTSRDCFVLNDVRVFRDGDPKACVATLRDAAVAKDHVRLVVINGRKHEAPQKRFDSYRSKTKHDVFLAVPGYVVHGQLQLEQSADSLSALLSDLHRFVAITDARISMTSGVSFSTNVVLANKRFVTLLAVGDSVNAIPAEEQSIVRGAPVV